MFTVVCISAASVLKIDSLKSALASAREDSDKLRSLLKIASYYNEQANACEENITASQEALDLAVKHHYLLSQAVAFSNIALYYELKGGNNDKALDYFLKAIDIEEKQSLLPQLCNEYIRLSDFYRVYMKNNKKALEYSLKGLEVAKRANTKSLEAKALATTGTIYYEMSEYRNSVKYLTTALSIMDSLGLKEDAATTINNLGSAYTELKVYDTAIAYYQKSISLYKELNNSDGLAFTLANIGNLYDMKNEPAQGIAYSLQALTIARLVGDKDLVAGIYSFLAEGYSKMGDYQNAFRYQSQLSDLKDTLFNESNARQVNDMQVKYDTEKKEKENKILELNINRQKLVNYSITVGLILVTILVFFIYRGYVNKKKAHEELSEKNKIIEEKNKDILDSINYAKTIQTAILTPDEYLHEELKDYFILYKPRDVVSGDFYWCHSRENKVIFAVSDCTGHGVPGAFMSMIGNSLLNEVVIENKITDAGQILNTLRANLLKTLMQNGKNTVSDGMDIALCVWDKNTSTLQFAGANNPMYLIRSGLNGSIGSTERVKIHGDNLAEFLPDKQPIGHYETKTNAPFRSQTVQLQKGDIIYISSDGYTDQFGGDKNKKFTTMQFRDLLCTLTGKGLEEQKQILERTIEDWKGNYAQTDDICLMGIKFS